MAIVSKTRPPQDSLLHTYADGPGAYADCFEAIVPRVDAPHGAFARFIHLFFDSRLFRLERMVLRLSGKAPVDSTDPIALALGEQDRFAAWIVEARRPTELLLNVSGTPIRTWLAVQERGDHTVLQFGSAILPSGPQNRPHWGFRATMGAHRVYSRMLLRAAVSDWRRSKDLPG